MAALTGQRQLGGEGAQPRIFAIVVNWNRPGDTSRCLASLDAQRGAVVRTVVIDNGSSDDSVARIRSAWPGVAVISNQENRGFAAAANQGIRYALDAGAELLLVINNDATLHPDALATLTEFASGERVGAIAPVIYDADSPHHIWSAGGKLRPLLLEPTHHLEGRADTADGPVLIEQDFVTACCCLVPRRTFEQVGLFDEQFTLYYEDFDFACRIRAQDFRILVVRTAKAWHRASSSSGGADMPNERYWMARSSIRFFRKHARGLRIVPIVFWRTASALRTTLRLVGKRQFRSVPAYWRGLRDGFLAAPRITPGNGASPDAGRPRQA